MSFGDSNAVVGRAFLAGR